MANRIAILALAASMLGGAPALAASSCNAACLEKTMAGYLAKLQTGNAAGVPLAAGGIVRENSHPSALGDGLWKQAGPIRAQQTFVDPTTGNAWSYAAMQLKGGKIAQISVRLKVDGSKISEIETIANTGMRDRSAPYPGGPYDVENVLEQDLLYTAIVPPARRSTREELIKLADGYFEGIGTHKDNTTKYGARCERYESGMRGTNQLRRNADQGPGPGPGAGGPPPGAGGPPTGAGGPPPGPAWSGTCGSSLTGLTGQQTIQRRFPVVDVERGVVVGYMFIEHHERTPPMDNFINEMFKVVDGKIQHMDAVGFNVPAPATSGFR